MPSRMRLAKRLAPSRVLTERERAFLEQFFAGSLELSPIRIGSSIGRRSWSPFGARISLTLGHFAEADPRAEVVLDNPLIAQTLAHEALHVWQRQHGQWVTLRGIPLQAGYVLGLFDPYQHARSADPHAMLQHFVTGNIEQQARIFERYVGASLIGDDITAYAEVAQLVRNAGSA